MPTCSSDGVPFTNSQQLLDVWQDFLGRKLSCEDLPGAAFAPEQPVEDDENTVSFEEFEESVNAIRKGKTPGLDDSPIDVYLASPHAKQELYEIVCILWRKEEIPPELVQAVLIMLYKKAPRNDFANYRAIGLLCHSYKVLSILVLRRMQDRVEQYLPDTQAGFRKGRGCRDNVLVLKLLMDAILKADEEAIATFIDYTAAFDSISHRFLDEALTDAGVSTKVRRIIRAIYSTATGIVRIKQPSGDMVYSGTFDIRRGAIQGDIFSPPCFTVGLFRIFGLYDVKCDGIGGSHLNTPVVPKLEYADDVGLLNKTASDASIRTSALASGSREAAGMEISLKKTKVMPIRRFESVSETLEEEVAELNLKFKCPKCSRPFPTQRGMNIHRARWCKPRGRPRSRKGTLADKAVQLKKRKAQAAALEPVVVNGHQLENVLRFEYLGCQFSGDGDDTADIRHRMAVAQERFASLWHIWQYRRLPIPLKL